MRAYTNYNPIYAIENLKDLFSSVCKHVSPGDWLSRGWRDRGISGNFKWSFERRYLVDYSTLSKITGFWLDERSTVNPKLYSQEYQLLFFSNLTRSLPKFSEVLRSPPKTSGDDPNISEVYPKSSKDFRSWSEDFRRFPKLTRKK